MQRRQIVHKGRVTQTQTAWGTSLTLAQTTGLSTRSAACYCRWYLMLASNGHWVLDRPQKRTLNPTDSILETVTRRLGTDYRVHPGILCNLYTVHLSVWKSDPPCCMSPPKLDTRLTLADPHLLHCSYSRFSWGQVNWPYAT